MRDEKIEAGIMQATIDVSEGDLADQAIGRFLEYQEGQGMSVEAARVQATQDARDAADVYTKLRQEGFAKALGVMIETHVLSEILVQRYYRGINRVAGMIAGWAMAWDNCENPILAAQQLVELVEVAIGAAGERATVVEIAQSDEEDHLSRRARQQAAAALRKRVAGVLVEYGL